MGHTENGRRFADTCLVIDFYHAQRAAEFVEGEAFFVIDFAAAEAGNALCTIDRDTVVGCGKCFVASFFDCSCHFVDGIAPRNRFPFRLARSADQRLSQTIRMRNQFSFFIDDVAETYQRRTFCAKAS